jgi:hypothetical protein
MQSYETASKGTSLVKCRLDIFPVRDVCSPVQTPSSSSSHLKEQWKHLGNALYSFISSHGQHRIPKFQDQRLPCPRYMRCCCTYSGIPIPIPRSYAPSRQLKPNVAFLNPNIKDCKPRVLHGNAPSIPSPCF